MRILLYPTPYPPDAANGYGYAQQSVLMRGNSNGSEFLKQFFARFTHWHLLLPHGRNPRCWGKETYIEECV